MPSDLFGQGRELGSIYDAGDTNADLDRYNEMIDALVRAGMDNDSIEDELRNMDQFGMVNDMRQGSATGNVNPEELKMLMQGMIEMDTRKRMSPEEIHNLGVMYGSPLNQERINYFEDQMNRDPNESYRGQFPAFPKG